MLESIRKIVLFDNLTCDELDKIKKICSIETHLKDKVLFREGESGDRCFVIIQGEVRISKFIPNIGEEALAILKPGDYFGEMALIDDFPRSAHAIANTDIQVLSIHKTNLHTVLTEDREMAHKLLWTFTRTLSKRLRETNEKMAAFLAMSGGF
ncbi:MAG: cyclic nucleotide-binding domain-containing protein [Nitrospirota bacterium]